MGLNEHTDTRWKQRFQNFSKARAHFHEAQAAIIAEPENQLYRMALIQAFEFTYELGWKTVKDYLDYNGVSASLPRQVIKEGFAFGVIEDGDSWIKMLEDRNMMSHAYDESVAKRVVKQIVERYSPAIDQLFTFFDNNL